MQLFSGKPKQSPALSKPSSTDSGRTGSAPAAPRPSGTPSPPSKARPTASVLPPASPQPPQGGTTVQQALAARQALATLQETHGLAGQAVGMLADLTAPKERDDPSQIDELLQALTVMMESQRRIEEKVDRLSAVLRPRSV